MIPIAIDESIRGIGDLVSSMRKIIPAKINGNKNIIIHMP
jgi:hypothetical protein